MRKPDGLGSNVKPAKRGGIFAHWVEYDINANGQPIKLGADDLIFGQLTKGFKSQMEALIWLKGNELQGVYLGEGTLEQLKKARL